MTIQTITTKVSSTEPSLTHVDIRKPSISCASVRPNSRMVPRPARGCRPGPACSPSSYGPPVPDPTQAAGGQGLRGIARLRAEEHSKAGRTRHRGHWPEREERAKGVGALRSCGLLRYYCIFEPKVVDTPLLTFVIHKRYGKAHSPVSISEFMGFYRNEMPEKVPHLKGCYFVKLLSYNSISALGSQPHPSPQPMIVLIRNY